MSDSSSSYASESEREELLAGRRLMAERIVALEDEIESLKGLLFEFVPLAQYNEAVLALIELERDHVS